MQPHLLKAVSEVVADVGVEVLSFGVLVEAEAGQRPFFGLELLESLLKASRRFGRRFFFDADSFLVVIPFFVLSGSGCGDEE